jgi:hypothetical protein
MREAGHNVFSDCNEKLERSSEAGTTMSLLVWSVARLSRGLRMDRIPRSPRTLVPGAARSEREYKASHGKTARARVVVQVAAPAAAVVHF